MGVGFKIGLGGTYPRRELTREARSNMRDLKAEIIARLQASVEGRSLISPR
jgi:hypothetical protein